MHTGGTMSGRDEGRGGDGSPATGAASGEAGEHLRELLRAPLDPLLADTNRLRLLAALIGLPPAGELTFTALRALLGLTDGNLGLHLRTLVEHGYAEVRKEGRGRLGRSLYRATSGGRAAFATHVAALEAIVAAARG
jgi:DNA-binding transcriptional ArsR family regulator